MGGQKYFCDFVEADINDSLILGIDFLRKYSCKVDFGRSVVEMSNGEEVFASYHRQDSGSFHISRVLANKKVSIKPRTAKRKVWVSSGCTIPRETNFKERSVCPFHCGKRCSVRGNLGDESIGSPYHAEEEFFTGYCNWDRCYAGR